MNSHREQILLVESDPNVSDVIADQILRPLGYEVIVAGSFDAALRMVEDCPPDLMITDLGLNGLSGKDLLLALSSEGIYIPVILLSQVGFDSEILGTLRLGVKDFLCAPFREAEVVSSVERLLVASREEQARDQSVQQLVEANTALRERVRVLLKILSIGRALISIRNPAVLFDKIVDSAVGVSSAEGGWLLLRKDGTEAMWLMAARGLPSLQAKRNLVWDDGISAGVIRSGTVVMTQEEALNLGEDPAEVGSALCVPIRTEAEIVGTLSVFRSQTHPFTQKEADLVEAVAEYAGVALVNASLQWNLKQSPPGR